MNSLFDSQSDNISNLEPYYLLNKKFLAKAIKDAKENQKAEAKEKKRVKAKTTKKKNKVEAKAAKQKRSVETKAITWKNIKNKMARNIETYL